MQIVIHLLEHLIMETRPCRVLVVDDLPDSAYTLAHLLYLWGYEVEVTSDSADALKIAQTREPDVVLMDIAMPGMDGWETVRRLREQEVGNKALCIAVTAFGRDEDRQRSRQAGFDGHLVKPLDPDVLKQVIGTNRRVRDP
jgi:CheY-like chemotaxis protein